MGENEDKNKNQIISKFPLFFDVCVCLARGISKGVMKGGRKETESGVEVGTDVVIIGYNNNKQTKKLEIGKKYILRKQLSIR